MIEALQTKLKSKSNVFDMPNWDNYMQTQDFQDIYNYIQQEYEVFNVYYHQLSLNVKKNYLTTPYSSNFITQEFINNDFQQPVDSVLKKVLTENCRFLIKDIVSNKNRPLTQQKKLWIHVNRLLDCLILHKVHLLFRSLSSKMKRKYSSTSSNITRKTTN